MRPEENNTQLTWDGISKEDINDIKKRRMGYKAYTDDFLQQIYSLNSSMSLGKKLSFRNVSYLVMGKGYYEVFKEDQDFCLLTSILGQLYHLSNGV